ncbi:MAG: Ig-like domain repeat protein [Acidobacteriaceae bacterium]|nr:Ig-like domain repeat protein [Acidobacteriaceae bacterium]
MAGRSLVKRLALSIAVSAASLLPMAAQAQLQAFSLASTTTTTFPTTTLGATSASQTIQLTTSRAVTITGVAVAPSANSHQEFTVGTMSGCAVNSAAAAGTTCSIPVTFSPFYAGTRAGQLTVTDSTGAVYTVGLTGLGDGPQTLLTPTDITTAIGASGGVYYSGDGGVATSARIGYPYGVSTDAYKNIYIADYSTQNIRVIYQAGAALACVIEIENPTLFGLTAGTTSCTGANAAPVAGNVYTLAGNTTLYSTTVTSHTAGTTVSTLAASPTATTMDDPFQVTVDSEGNVLVSSYLTYDLRVIYVGGDKMGCLIELENPSLFGLATGATSCTGATSAPIPGYLYRIGGTSSPGASGDGGIATSALMAYGYGITTSPDGDIFFLDVSTNSARTTRIRVIYNGGAAAAALIQATNQGVTPQRGYVYKVAGGVFGTSGDGAIATSAGITYSKGLKVDAYGNIIFTDYNTSATITTLPLEARVRVIYNAGTRMASLIQKETGSTAVAGYVYTLAGSTAPGATSGNGGAASAANFVTPYGVTVDPAGDIFVVDYGDKTIRRISVADGNIYAYAGISGTSSVTNGNSLTTGGLWLPIGLAVAPDGGIDVADYGIYRVRVVGASASAIAYASAVPVGTTGTPTFVYLQNLGTEPVTVASTVASANFAVVAGTTGALYATDCSTLPTLQPGDSCSAGVALAPTALGAATGTLTITDNSNGVSTQHVVTLTGTASYQSAVTLTSSTNPTFAGDTVTLTANVAAAAGQDTTTAPALIGTVKFTDGTATLATVSIDSSGNATTTDGPLTGGTHSIKATFTPDSTIAAQWAGASASLSQVATAITTTTTLTSSAANANQNANVTFTAVVAAAGTIPTSAPAIAGTVAFTVDGVAITGSPVTVDATGTATISTSTMTVASHTIVATFTPSSVYYATSTATITQVVSSPSYSVLSSNTGVAVATGTATVVPFSVTSVGGYTGTVSASCGTLPSYMTCSFSPKSVAFTGTNTTQTINLSIGTTGGSAALATHSNGITFAALFGAGLLALLAGKRRKLPAVLMIVLGLAAAATITGCGKTATASRGTQNINVTFTDGTTSYTVVETVSVIGNP